MNCPTCGATLDGTSTVCPACGSETEVELHATHHCPACGQPLPSGATTCTRCGANLAERRTSLFAVFSESLLVTAIVAGVLIAVWLLRPQPAAPAAATAAATAPVVVAGLPTPVPTRTATLTPSPIPPTPTATETWTITPTPLPAVLDYAVEKGDSLYTIARKFDTHVADIVAASGLPDDKVTLRIGQKLVIPLAPAALAPAATPTAPPEANPTGTPPAPEANPTGTPPAPEPSPTAVLITTTTHRIASGETLLVIASKYNTTVAAIVKANNFNNQNQMLRIGQELIIPLATPIEATPVPPTATAPPPAQPAPATPEPPAATAPPAAAAEESNAVKHTVQKGDTLLGIAGKYGTTVKDLVQANNLRDDGVTLRIGQVLTIRGGPASTPSVTPAPFASPTPAFTATAWPTVAGPTQTPAFPYSAPIALGPPDGRVYDGRDTAVLLNWTSVGILNTDDWYVLRVRVTRGDQETEKEYWIKTTSWRVPDELRPPAGGEAGRYRWEVVVRRQAPTPASAGAGGDVLSPPSATRDFAWSP